MDALRRANLLAQKGRLDEAAELYGSILSAYPEHPGVLFSEGLARLRHGDPTGGTERLERALAACPNYHPLLRVVPRTGQRPERD